MFLSIGFVWLTLTGDAQLSVAQIIKNGIKKVIIAVDLKIPHYAVVLIISRRLSSDIFIINELITRFNVFICSTLPEGSLIPVQATTVGFHAFKSWVNQKTKEQKVLVKDGYRIFLNVKN